MPPTTTLHHTRRGHSGPAVVLLHGLGSSCREWEFQEVALEPRYRGIAVDLPGHGNSAPPRAAVTIETMADEVGALLATLDEEPVHVVGRSLGACVALRLGLQLPGRVRSLTLVNPFTRVQPTGPRDVARLLVRLTMLSVAPMRMFGAHVARGLFPWPEQRALYEAAVTSLGATSRRGYAAARRALAQFDARGQVAAIRRPTLVVAGDRDTMVPLAPKLRLGPAVPRAARVVGPVSG